MGKKSGSESFIKAKKLLEVLISNLPVLVLLNLETVPNEPRAKPISLASALIYVPLDDSIRRLRVEKPELITVSYTHLRAHET